MLSPSFVVSVLPDRLLPGDMAVMFVDTTRGKNSLFDDLESNIFTPKFIESLKVVMRGTG